jgi:hypothetical protein
VRPTEHRPLGEILLQARLVTPEQLDRAVAFHRQHGVRLGEALVRLGMASEDDVAWALSTQLGLPYVHLRADLVDPQAFRMLPVDTQRRLGVVLVLAREGEVTVAVSDPTDRRLLDEVERLCGLRPYPVVALASNIRETLDALARSGPPEGNGDLALRLVLSDAARRGATHVYVEPLPGRVVRVRYRSPEGVRVAEGLSVPWESLAALRDRARPGGPVCFEVVLGDRSVQARLFPLRTRWGPALAGSLVALPADPLQDDAGLPTAVWDSVLAALQRGGLVAAACPDGGLRDRLLRSAAARLAARWGGVVVLCAAAGLRPAAGVVEGQPAEAVRWQQARPDALVAEVTGPGRLRRVALNFWPGQRLVVGLPGYRARQARALLEAARAAAPVRGVLAAVPVPALCGCARVHHGAPGWPSDPPPVRWGSPTGCDRCRHTGLAGEAVAYEWAPVDGPGVSMESVARGLVEALRVAPEHLVPALEG